MTDLPRYLNLVLDSGVKPAEISEIITHLAFYSGWSNAMDAVRTTRSVFASRGIGADQLPQESIPKLALDAAAEAQRAERVGQQFASLGYGAMTTFSVLYFAQQIWQPAWLSFTAFALALIVARLLLGGLPDRMGGATAAMTFAILQAIGMGLMGLSSTALSGFVGATLTGFGYAFVYPGFGIEAVRRAPPESAGLAMGVFTAFLDFALGILAPLLGLVANAIGLGSVFVISALLALCAVPVAIRLRSKPELQKDKIRPDNSPNVGFAELHCPRNLSKRSIIHESVS